MATKHKRARARTAGRSTLGKNAESLLKQEGKLNVKPLMIIGIDPNTKGNAEPGLHFHAGDKLCKAHSDKNAAASESVKNVTDFYDLSESEPAPEVKGLPRDKLLLLIVSQHGRIIEQKRIIERTTQERYRAENRTSLALGYFNNIIADTRDNLRVIDVAREAIRNITGR